MKINHKGSYAKRRKDEYPPLADQLDALWHAMDQGTLPVVPAFYEPIKRVKDTYQKEIEATHDNIRQSF